MTIPRSKPQNAMDCPLVQYASGHTKFRNDRSARSWSGLVGFHAECGVVPAFDHACTAAGIARIDIRHTTGRDQAEIKQQFQCSPLSRRLCNRALPKNATRLLDRDCGVKELTGPLRRSLSRT